jgi:hypothetical protein
MVTPLIELEEFRFQAKTGIMVSGETMTRIKLPVQELERLKVGLVYLFGSQALEIESPLSDVDIGIVFFDRKFLDDFRMRKKTYTELYDIFADTSSPTLEGELDIVFLQQTPLDFQHDVIVKGKVLYQRNPKFRVDYEEQVLDAYLDFKPVIDYFDQMFLERLG